MTPAEAHELLNAAQAGLMVSSQSITEALVVTGDMLPCQRTMNQPVEVTRALPRFEPAPPMPPKNPRPPVATPSLPKLVHKPWSVGYEP